MAEISATAVKDLRERTGLPMMKCKEALQASGGDADKAIAWLKSQVKGLMEKRADNATTEGQIRVLIRPDAGEGAMVEVQCESAPVAGGEDLTKFAEQLVTQLLEGPGANTPEELLAQNAPGAKSKLSDIYEDIVNRIREKIVVSRVARVKGPVGGYVHHDRKTGVLFRASGTPKSTEILRDAAMHVAALKPTVTRPEELDPALVQAERDRLSEEARSTGKPENIIAKIVDGRMGNFYDQHGVLLYQAFAKDDKKTVQQALAEQGLKAEQFIRWVIGR
jgi:elongation factor Ts